MITTGVLDSLEVSLLISQADLLDIVGFYYGELTVDMSVAVRLLIEDDDILDDDDVRVRGFGELRFAMGWLMSVLTVEGR